MSYEPQATFQFVKNNLKCIESIHLFGAEAGDVGQLASDILERIVLRPQTAQHVLGTIPIRGFIIL